jgi:hypothetical protein
LLHRHGRPADHPLEFFSFQKAVGGHIRAEVKENLLEILSASIVDENTSSGREVKDTLYSKLFHAGSASTDGLNWTRK